MLRLRQVACGFVVGLLWGTFCLTACAQTRVEVLQGQSPRGTVKSIGRETIGVETRNGMVQVPVTNVRLMRFEGEPSEMIPARSAALGGRYEDGLEFFKKLENESLEGANALYVRQDIAFYQALCIAKLSLSGDENHSLAKAETQLSKFLSDHSTSYHYLEATELLGDIRTTMGKHADAQAAYQELTRSSIDAIRLRGLVAQGYSLLSQDKVSEAKGVFSDVTAANPSSPEARRYVEIGKVGTASCLAATGQAQKGVAMVMKVIEDNDEDTALFAKAYNTLGQCYQKLGNQKEALMAYLHVHLLYSSQAQEHAQALLQLSLLWKQLDNEQRAAEARTMLKQRYGNSFYAQQL